jgi:hypothetical protein
MANPFPFVAGSVLTAAELNGIGEAWTSYTPTLTIGINPTFTISYSKYAQVNKLIVYRFRLLTTQAGTASAAIVLSLPVLAAANGGTFLNVCGSAVIYNVSTTTSTTVAASFRGTTSIDFISSASTGGSPYGTSPAVTLGSGSYITGEVIYEAA